MPTLSRKLGCSYTLYVRTVKQTYVRTISTYVQLSHIGLSRSATSSGDIYSMNSSIYGRALSAPRGEVSLSAFAYLFSEIVQYTQNRVASVSDLITRLEELGYSIGQKALELISIRERITKREIRLVTMLQYISTVFWKFLFSKQADNLEKSIENDDECRSSYIFNKLSHSYSPLFL